MSGKVFERRGHSIDEKGFIRYDERPMTFIEAEKIHGGPLDRRRNYAVIAGKICISVRWVDECSGCKCDCGDEYPCGHGAGGCRECGYTGKAVQGMWTPIDETEPVEELEEQTPEEIEAQDKFVREYNRQFHGPFPR